MFHQILHSFIHVAHAAEAAAETGAKPSVTQLFGLNVKLFIAQLINFAIILFVLWKYAFGPIGKKLTERSEKIERSLEQAREIEQKHAQAEQDRLAALEQARKEATEIIERAEKSANQSKTQILEEAKVASQKLLQQTQAQIEDQKNKVIREINEQAATMVVVATERILREKLDPKKDEKLIKESLKNI